MLRTRYRVLRQLIEQLIGREGLQRRGLPAEQPAARNVGAYVAKTGKSRIDVSVCGEQTRTLAGKTRHEVVGRAVGESMGSRHQDGRHVVRQAIQIERVKLIGRIAAHNRERHDVERLAHDINHGRGTDADSWRIVGAAQERPFRHRHSQVSR